MAAGTVSGALGAAFFIELAKKTLTDLAASAGPLFTKHIEKLMSPKNRGIVTALIGNFEPVKIEDPLGSGVWRNLTPQEAQIASMRLNGRLDFLRTKAGKRKENRVFGALCIYLALDMDPKTGKFTPGHPFARQRYYEMAMMEEWQFYGAIESLIDDPFVEWAKKLWDLNPFAADLKPIVLDQIDQVKNSGTEVAVTIKTKVNDPLRGVLDKIRAW